MHSSISSNFIFKQAKVYGDSFYLFEPDVFESNYFELANAFKQYYKKFNIAYSYKTNYIPQLVKIVDRLGGFAEVVSDMELEIALRSGVSPKNIIWNGPIKNCCKVNEVLLSGGTVNIDSSLELNNIISLAKKHPQKTINIGIRCNYDVGDNVVSRFGVDVGGLEFDLILRTIMNISNINLISLQAHFAKRAPRYWKKRAEKMVSAYDLVVEKYGMKPERLDIGGGIYGRMPDSLRKQLGVDDVKYEDYAILAGQVFANRFEADNDAPYLFIEPGTALAGDCMKFVCRVETIKSIRGKIFITVSGSQKNISMSGINPPITIVNCGEKQTFVEDADIVGYTCIEGDVLQKGFNGMIAIGDYVIIDNCGSYSLVMKPPFILPNYPVLEVVNDSVKLIKRSESFDDLFSSYYF